MESSARLLEQAQASLAEVARRGTVALVDEELCATIGQVEGVGRLVDAIRAAAAGDVDARSAYGFGADGLAQRNGHVRGVDLIEQLTRVSKAEALRRVRLGSEILPSVHLNGEPSFAGRPLVAAAMAAGSIGADAATAICRALTDASRTAATEDLTLAESALVEAATTETADTIRQEAIIWREFLDPDGAEPRADRAYRKRGVRIGRETDGISVATVTMESIGRAKLLAIFDEACGPRVAPRFLSDRDRHSGQDRLSDAHRPNEHELEHPRALEIDGIPTDVVADSRTREQKQYDCLFGTITAGMRSTDPALGGMRSTSTVTAVIRLKDLRECTGVGGIDGAGDPVPVQTVRQMICDAGYEPLLLGDNGQVLNHGRRVEMFTASQRRALAVRDGGCVWPGCTAPPTWTEAHHVRQRGRGREGPTDVDNGALLCSAHHHLLHRGDYEMRMIDGRPHLLAPTWIDPRQKWRRLGRVRAIATPGRRM